MQLTTATRNVAGDALGALPDVGGTGAAQFKDSGNVTIVECALSANSFGASSTGVITAAAITQGTAVAAGTIDKCLILNGSDAEQWRYSVSTTAAGTGEIQGTTVTMGIGDKLDVSALTLTVPAGS